MGRLAGLAAGIAFGFAFRDCSGAGAWAIMRPAAIRAADEIQRACRIAIFQLVSLAEGRVGNPRYCTGLDGNTDSMARVASWEGRPSMKTAEAGDLAKARALSANRFGCGVDVEEGSVQMGGCG